MNKPTTYGVQYNVTDRSYTVIVNGVTGRNFKTNEAALAYIDQSKRATSYEIRHGEAHPVTGDPNFYPHRAGRYCACNACLTQIRKEAK